MVDEVKIRQILRTVNSKDNRKIYEQRVGRVVSSSNVLTQVFLSSNWQGKIRVTILFRAAIIRGAIQNLIGWVHITTFQLVIANCNFSQKSLVQYDLHAKMSVQIIVSGGIAPTVPVITMPLMK